MIWPRLACLCSWLALLTRYVATLPSVQVQLLGGAAQGERSMFRLTASLGTLQVLLNYEGSGCHTLSQVRCTRLVPGHVR